MRSCFQTGIECLSENIWAEDIFYDANKKNHLLFILLNAILYWKGKQHEKCFNRFGNCAAIHRLRAYSASTGGTDSVYKSDGARQCEGGGIAPEIMLKELDGIHVYAARKQLMQGVMVPAVCGGTTGSINVYNIAAEDQAAAEQRGFGVLPPRKNKNPIFQ